MKVQATHRSPAHCRGMVFCLPPHSLNYFALCSRQLLCPATETFNLEHQVKPGGVLLLPHPFSHPTWLLLKRSLADSFPPLRCDRWQAPVKTSYLRRAPSTVGPFCPPAALPHHPPFPPVPTIPVQLVVTMPPRFPPAGPFPIPGPRLASLWSIMHTTTLTQLSAHGGV